MTDLSRRSFARGAVALSAMAAAHGGMSRAQGSQSVPAATQEGVPMTRPPAEDRLDLIELMALYTWAYDCEDADLLRSTFTDDGVLEVFGNVLATAAGGFADFLAMARAMKQGKGWQHLADHHLFRDYDGQKCVIFSYYTMAEGNAAGGEVSMRAMGYYVSECRRTEAGWKFSKRSVVRWNGRLPFH
jgi:hypothetical protein